MGYERDPDHATRGAGAIAALDRPGSVRAQKRIIAARATIQRDRKMAAVTMGALGRVDRESLLRGRGSLAPAPVKPAPAPTPVRPVAPAPVTGIKVAPTYGTPIRLPTPSQIMTPFPVRVPAPAPMPQTRFPIVMPPIVSPPIIALPPPATVSTVTTTTPATATTPATTSTTTVRTTSGGMSSGAGTVSSTGGVRPGIQIGPPASMPPLQLPQPAIDNTMRNLLLVGGGTLALILILRNRGG